MNAGVGNRAERAALILQVIDQRTNFDERVILLVVAQHELEERERARCKNEVEVMKRKLRAALILGTGYTESEE